MSGDLDGHFDSLYHSFGGRVAGGSDARAVEMVASTNGHEFRLQAFGACLGLCVPEGFPVRPPHLLWMPTRHPLPSRLAPRYRPGELLSDFAERAFENLRNILRHAGVDWSEFSVHRIMCDTSPLDAEALIDSANASAAVSQSRAQRLIDNALAEKVALVEACAETNVGGRARLEEAASRVIACQCQVENLRSRCEELQKAVSGFASLSSALQRYGDATRALEIASNDAADAFVRQVPDDEDAAAENFIQRRKLFQKQKLLLRAHKSQSH
uniref:Uncharacterized protein n=1 Tax=Neobodo designis TaxID=312471 RepID=A0A7S1L1G7_NEODS